MGKERFRANCGVDRGAGQIKVVAVVRNLINGNKMEIQIERSADIIRPKGPGRSIEGCLRRWLLLALPCVHFVCVFTHCHVTQKVGLVCLSQAEFVSITGTV